MTIAQNELRDEPRAGDAVKRGDVVSTAGMSTGTTLANRSRCGRTAIYLTFTSGILVGCERRWVKSQKVIPFGKRHSKQHVFTNGRKWWLEDHEEDGYDEED